MTEERKRLRARGSQFDPRELSLWLYAFGDTRNPLPTTVSTLDSIITDYIIETCHEAAAHASHARRAKIKLDDFRWMLRRDAEKLGRVQYLISEEKAQKKTRRMFEDEPAEAVKDGPGRGRKRIVDVEESVGDAMADSVDGTEAGAGGQGKKKRRKKKDKERILVGEEDLEGDMIGVDDGIGE
jgi:transcription initiation factor TFIID subunit 13